MKAITAEEKATIELHSRIADRREPTFSAILTGSTVVSTQCRRHPSRRANLNQVRDLLNLRSDLTVHILQRDGVNACQVYLIKGYRESLVVHQIEIPKF